MTYTATYSPDDNKLRLYATTRLDAETYARVKAAGFKWAPQQGLFVAPMWTPEREALLIELAGEIDDEDTTLRERQEERAERFEDYHDNRTEDAERARQAVHRIADNIPLGQPILIGHHSERHARRDAKRIEAGMRKAVQMWETAAYWERRAKSAIQHAKYKERPDVRARRIKGIETDARKVQRTHDEAAKFLKTYLDPEAPAFIPKNGKPLISALLQTYEGGLSYEDMRRHEKGEVTTDDAKATAIANLTRTVDRCRQWLTHYANRLTYERAMLAESGGTVTDRTGPEKGGACRCWASPRNGWSYIQKVNRVTVTVLDNWGNGGGNFTRTIPFDKLSAVMTAAQVHDAKTAGRLNETGDGLGFYLLEESTLPVHHAPRDVTPAPPTEFDAMKASLKAGVQTISAPQLFPTPVNLARQMVALAEIQPGHRVLEPSGGSGRLILAIKEAAPKADLFAVEVKPHLADVIRSAYCVPTYCQDFLTCNGALGLFDRIIMNPPFSNGEDLKHILHARTLLAPGGRIVALCANGPRQREALQPLADTWEALPAGSFEESGTSVNVALLTLTKGELPGPPR